MRFGRPEKARPQEYASVRGLVAMGELSHGEAAARLGVCRSTFEKWLRQDGRNDAARAARGVGDDGLSGESAGGEVFCA